MQFVVAIVDRGHGPTLSECRLAEKIEQAVALGLELVKGCYGGQYPNGANESLASWEDTIRETLYQDHEYEFEVGDAGRVHVVAIGTIIA